MTRLLLDLKIQNIINTTGIFILWSLNMCTLITNDDISYVNLILFLIMICFIILNSTTCDKSLIPLFVLIWLITISFYLTNLLSIYVLWFLNTIILYIYDKKLILIFVFILLFIKLFNIEILYYITDYYVDFIKIVIFTILNILNAAVSVIFETGRPFFEQFHFTSTPAECMKKNEDEDEEEKKSDQEENKSSGAKLLESWDNNFAHVMSERSLVGENYAHNRDDMQNLFAPYKSSPSSYNINIPQNIIDKLEDDFKKFDISPGIQAISNSKAIVDACNSSSEDQKAENFKVLTDFAGDVYAESWARLDPTPVNHDDVFQNQHTQ